MNNRFERSLVIGILLLVIALTVYSMVTSLAKTAYDVTARERATVAAQASAVAATLTAVK